MDRWRRWERGDGEFGEVLSVDGNMGEERK